MSSKRKPALEAKEKVLSCSNKQDKTTYCFYIHASLQLCAWIIFLEETDGKATLPDFAAMQKALVRVLAVAVAVVLAALKVAAGFVALD